MDSFSKRNGYVKYEPIGEGKMTEEFKNQIYNFLYEFFLKNHFDEKSLYHLTESIWKNLLKKPITELDKLQLVGKEERFLLESTSSQEELSPYSMNKYLIIKKILEFFYMKEVWFYTYDFIEFILKEPPIKSLSISKNKNFVNELNQIFIENNVQYRIVDSKIVPITNDTEIKEIERSLNLQDKFSSSRTEIKKAIIALSRKEKPDFINAIKHSINSVEATLKIIFDEPNETLGKLLNKLNNKKKFYTTYKSIINKISAWINNDGPFRHSHTEQFNDDEFHNEAKLILVTCSTFINYIIAEHAEGNI